MKGAAHRPPRHVTDDPVAWADAHGFRPMAAQWLRTRILALVGHALDNEAGAAVIAHARHQRGHERTRPEDLLTETEALLAAKDIGAIDADEHDQLARARRALRTVALGDESEEAMHRARAAVHEASAVLRRLARAAANQTRRTRD